MRSFRFICIVLAIGIWSVVGDAAESRSSYGQSDYFFYAAAGPAYQFPGALRIGINSWEFGLLTVESFGFDKVFRFESKYMAFGICGVAADTPGAGFFGAAGWEPKLVWGISFRAELNAVAASNAFVKGEAYVGLGFHL